MDLNPKYSQPPDSRRYSQQPDEPHLERTCKRQGCGGSVDPETGTCRRCGQRHQRLEQKLGQRNVPPHKVITQKSFQPEDIKPTPPPDIRYREEALSQNNQRNPESQYNPSGSTVSENPSMKKYIGSDYYESEQGNYFKKLKDWAIDLPNTSAFWWAMRGMVILLFGLIGFWVYYNLDWSANFTTKSDLYPNNSIIPLNTQNQLQTFELKVFVDNPEGGSVSLDPNETSYQSGTSVTLSATPAKGYTFDRWSGDVDIPENSDATTIIMDSDKQVTAHFKITDTTPPEISDIHVIKYSDTTATIAWKASETATGYVKYKKRDNDEYTNSSASTSDEINNHVVKLTGLSPNGIYYYIVELTDESENSTSSRSQVLTTLPPIKEGYEEGKRAPNLVLAPYENCSELPVKNGTLELTEFLGKKKLYINFWSTYCAPCVVEFPVLQKIYERPEEYEGWIMITVCIDGREDRILKLKEKYPELQTITLPTLFFTDRNDQTVYNIWKVPTSFFIDEDGIIRYVKLGRFYHPYEVKDVLDSI